MSKQKLPETLQLVRGDAILGTIQVKPSEDESPWHSGEFRATEEFEPVRELFEHELKLLQANTSNDSAQWEDWEAAHAELHEPGLRLQAPDKSYQADEILIHINGAEAWWRIE